MSEESDAIFARIARRYDLLNSILSLGQEQNWRKRGIARLPDGLVLDLGSGTGAAERVLAPRRVVALDPVREMLRLSPIAMRVAAAGESMPFADASFDGIFSAYVFRNLTSVERTLEEMRRVLKPGGIAVVVDLARPPGRQAARLHRAGTALVLPLVGLAAGAPAEYRYLHHSLDKLLPPEEMFGSGPLDLVETWRMGPLGFVYGAVLRRAG